jgi:hypothetical protein
MIAMRYLIVLFTLLPICAQAQELSAEDRACINTAIDKLPRVDGLRDGSRVLMSNPENRTRNKLQTTHSFFCHGDTVTIRALPVEVR